LLALLYGYSFQIFADFAGYSLMAIGFAALFGYKFPENFNYPYLSTSVTEFWRRWHMSLSSWLRDYLYIPLGGNRKGEARTYLNLMLVMFLGGLWHGAEWKFAIWGIAHGLFLAIERSCLKFSLLNTRRFTIVWALIKWMITFHVITLLWITFLMPNTGFINAFLNGVSNWNWNFSGPPIFSLLFYGAGVVIYHFWGWIKIYHEDFIRTFNVVRYEPFVLALMVFLILTNPGAPRGFIYFQF
jgi:alginate O-acetyltransferase complex protein AlgI